eukprot:341234-Chlamydomonas_euryale.AAC.1
MSVGWCSGSSGRRRVHVHDSISQALPHLEVWSNVGVLVGVAADQVPRRQPSRRRRRHRQRRRRHMGASGRAGRGAL